MGRLISRCFQHSLCDIRNITRYDVWNADECFLTGTAAEVIPVIEVDARKIGSGKPGPLTARILAEFRKKASREGQMIR